jgi:uncharacterized protein
MSKNINTKRILVYLAFGFGVPWTAALVISLSPLMRDFPLQAVSVANIFFIATPWLASIAARLITREGWGNLGLKPNFRRGWPYYLALWFLPLAATIAGGVVFYLLFPGSFDPNLGGVQKLIANSPSAAGVNPWTILLSITLSMMALSVPINTVVSMGEELGWRGYLLPKLINHFLGNGFEGAAKSSASTEASSITGSSHASSSRFAALLTGVVHGVWHWPLILMTIGISPGVSYITPLIYLVYTCSLSILLSWGTLRSGSVWPAAVGHGAANAFSALPVYLLLGLGIPLFGPDVTGLIGGIGYTLLALILFFSPRAFALRKQDSL